MSSGNVVSRYYPSVRTVGGASKDPLFLLNDMLWILRTGALWRDLTARYNTWERIYSRLQLWKQNGVFDGLLAKLREGADREGCLDPMLHHVAGTIIRAHLDRAG